MKDGLYPTVFDAPTEEVLELFRPLKEASEQAAQIRWELAGRLDQPGKKLFENLCAAYIREANLEIKDAYMQGLYDGMEMMMARHQRRGPS